MRDHLSTDAGLFEDEHGLHREGSLVAEVPEDVGDALRAGPCFERWDQVMLGCMVGKKECMEADIACALESEGLKEWVSKKGISLCAHRARFC